MASQQLTDLWEEQIIASATLSPTQPSSLGSCHLQECLQIGCCCRPRLVSRLVSELVTICRQLGDLTLLMDCFAAGTYLMWILRVYQKDDHVRIARLRKQTRTFTRQGQPLLWVHVVSSDMSGQVQLCTNQATLSAHICDIIDRTFSFIRYAECVLTCCGANLQKNIAASQYIYL